MLTPNEIVRVEDLCDRFETAWRSGQTPRIEQFLDAYGEPCGGELFRELLVLELIYRRQRNEHPSESEYTERFPDRTEVVAFVFNDERPACTPRYPLVRPIGYGGLGEVWLALDRSVACDGYAGREVAVKVIRSKWAASPDVEQRFLREARIRQN